MLTPASILERTHAAAHLISNALDIDCLIVGPESQIALELPPNHLGHCFCQRLQALTGKETAIDHFFSRCSQISEGENDESYFIYNCPYGLANIIVPAFDNGTFVAALQIGPILTDSPDELLMKHGAMSQGINVKDLQDVRNYLSGLPSGGISFIVSIAKMAKALITDEDLVLKSLSLEQDIDKSRIDSDEKNDVACAIQEFVLSNFTNNEISLEMVAKHVYVHPSYVSRIFSRKFGSHFRAYVNELRVDLAKDMLAKTDKSVGDICHEVGFSDHSYFNKVFKQYFGITPSKYRDQARAAAQSNKEDQ